MFVVLALGTLLDTTKPYDIRASEPFYQLAKAAFVVEPLIDAATIPVIQSLVSCDISSPVLNKADLCPLFPSQHFQIVYLYMTDRQTVEHRWLNMGLLTKLTFSVCVPLE